MKNPAPYKNKILDIDFTIEELLDKGEDYETFPQLDWKTVIVKKYDTDQKIAKLIFKKSFVPPYGMVWTLYDWKIYEQ